jgi:molecular chaperone GrpE
MAEETSKETIAGIEPEEENLNGCEPEQQAEETAEPAEEAGKQEEEETLQQPDAPENDVVDGIFTQEEENTGKKSFFKKKKDKRDEKIAELTDQVKRQMAEFDNFRKRSEREKSQMFDLGAKSVIEKILPVIDNFERGLAQAPDMTDPFVEGMEKIYKSMLQELEAIGVKPIEAEGKEFDPNLHNAVMHVEDDSLGENIVAQELQKGYTYHDSVVRHSMVKVAN